MDYLFFCTGECDDAMRDRDFYLVKNVVDEIEARERLAAYFLHENFNDSAEDYSVFVTGENIEDAMGAVQHWSYRFYTV